MNKKTEDASLSQYVWIVVKSLFLICFLILIISLFVMYFSMPDKIAQYLTIFSMFVGIALCGYETAEISPTRKKIAAFVVSLFVSIILVVVSIVLKRSVNISKYQLYLIIFGPILGFVMGALNAGKSRKPRPKRR
ncbi:TIGR04086 family membrane protein [Caldicellulosiruptor changbaiensis]|uniref:TIGR04086 family membrane protein n=1 Tax=Caldicellulosiruptor changbaiensis TaxID=1222016 RepID=A0A3T0D7G8_9FIRM|nr:TIGR04086 family membrane protein [Caldicellulosiruptor changbaiensis]AZT91057.1 TIGR04086 family membrane protein [Caldicellulosiruptor changbaiensis]